MIAPLKTMTVTGDFFELRSGSGLPDKYGKTRHIGVDLRASIGTPVYAPNDGTVTLVDNVGLKLVEIRIGDKLHRFLHLDRNVLSNGQSVKAGQLIGYSGNTGNVAAHLHWDARKAGTAWDASLYNYVDPVKLLEEGNDMPTEQQIKDIFAIAKLKPSASQITLYSGRHWTELAGNIAQYIRKQLVAEAAKVTKLSQENSELKKASTVLPPGNYRVEEG